MLPSADDIKANLEAEETKDCPCANTTRTSKVCMGTFSLTWIIISDSWWNIWNLEKKAWYKTQYHCRYWGYACSQCVRFWIWKKELLCCNSLIFSVAGVGHDPTTSGLWIKQNNILWFSMIFIWLIINYLVSLQLLKKCSETPYQNGFVFPLFSRFPTEYQVVT